MALRCSGRSAVFGCAHTDQLEVINVTLGVCVCVCILTYTVCALLNQRQGHGLQKL